MLNFVLCDDNLNILTKLVTMLETIFIKHNLNANVALASANPKEILDYTNKNHVDVIILDINLKSNISGIELAQKIRNVNKNIYLIFTTAHLEYLMVAYKVKTFDYLAKPITLERFEETILRLFEDINSSTKNFIRINSKLLLNSDEIEYIEKDGMSLIFQTPSKRYRTSGSFSKFESLLTDNFVRCHKSYVANIDNIKDVELSSNTIFFGNNKCYIGPKYKNNFMEVLKNGNFKHNLDGSHNSK